MYGPVLMQPIRSYSQFCLIGSELLLAKEGLASVSTGVFCVYGLVKPSSAHFQMRLWSHIGPLLLFLSGKAKLVLSTFFTSAR